MKWIYQEDRIDIREDDAPDFSDFWADTYSFDLHTSTWDFFDAGRNKIHPICPLSALNSTLEIAEEELEEEARLEAGIDQWAEHGVSQRDFL